MHQDQYNLPKAVLFIITGLLSYYTTQAQKWDTLAPVPTAFTFPVVAVLDGKIHIMGGGAAGGATKLHYAYDPSTDTWVSKAPLPYAAQQPAGSENNGLIHFFGGGYPNSGSPLKDHYAYSPDIDSWSKAADLTSPRAIHSSVSLDGTLYTLGGQGVSTLMEAYDEAADKWITKSNLPDGSFWYGAHVATEGHIYRFGGGGYTAPTNKANVYDPASDSWSSLPNLPNANHSIKAAAIGDKIFLAGGYYDFLDRDEVWIYDTKNKTYTAGPKLPIGRSYLNMATIDSCIYVIGGNNAVDPTVSTQLLRLCPFEKVSSVKDLNISNIVKANYSNGTISIWLPQQSDMNIHVLVFDQLGKQICTHKITESVNNSIQVRIGELDPAIYFVRLQSQDRIYLAKVFVL